MGENRGCGKTWFWALFKMLSTVFHLTAILAFLPLALVGSLLCWVWDRMMGEEA